MYLSVKSEFDFESSRPELLDSIAGLKGLIYAT